MRLGSGRAAFRMLVLSAVLENFKYAREQPAWPDVRTICLTQQQPAKPRPILHPSLPALCYHEVCSPQLHHFSNKYACVNPYKDYTTYPSAC